MEGVTFFGAVDRKGKKADGEIGSSYPAWYDQRKIEDLQNTIQIQEGMIERSEIQPEALMRAKAELERDKKLLATIEASKPKLKDKDLDSLKKNRDEIEKQIAESMFTKKQMFDGLADPHEEARRMSQPVIKVDPAFAAACGLKVDSNGKVSRNHATKLWQIAQSYLGDDRGTNVEALRRG